MSLIMGIPLDKKIYLISDSRVTEGSDHRDNFAKWNNLNSRLGVLGAGHLQMASYLIRQLRKGVNESDTFHELELLLKNELYNIATKFYTVTGSYSQSAALILGGFDPNLKMRTTSDRLAEVMARPVIRKGEGVSINQYVDLRFLEVMRELFEDGRETIEQGTVLEVDTPRPRCVAIYVYADQTGTKIRWEEPQLWECISFHPNWEADRVKLPGDVISDVEFGEVLSDESGDRPIYREYEHLINAVDRIVRDRNYRSVGGNIVPPKDR